MTSKALDFPREEYEARLELVRDEMVRRKLDLLILTSPDNIYYLTGYDSAGYYQFQAAVLTPDGPEPLLFVHKVEVVTIAETSYVSDVTFWSHSGKGESSTAPGDPFTTFARFVRKIAKGGDRIGVEKQGFFFPVGAYEQLLRELTGASLEDASDIVPELRAVKSKAEISYMRQAAKLADLAVEAAVNEARVGGTEIDILTAVSNTLTSQGSNYACLPPMILSGPRTAIVHQQATSRQIQRGDPVAIELAGVAARYNSNILRTFMPHGNESNAFFEDSYGLLVEALEHCSALVGPGVSGEQVDYESRRITERLGRYRLHRTGYGLEAGYPPAWMGRVHLAEGDPRILQEGMVISIEPTFILYDYPPGRRLGFYAGNNLLITDSGAEVLNACPLWL